MVREEEGVLLRHEKCNFGPLQEELRLEFDAEAKLFRRLGQVPGAAAARALVRSTQRIAVLRLLATACDRGQRLSMSVKASNNAWLHLREEPEFPHGVDRAAFFGLLAELQRDGLVHEVDYMSDHRKRLKSLELTDVGRLRVAQGSGAPAMWRRGGAGVGDE